MKNYKNIFTSLVLVVVCVAMVCVSGCAVSAKVSAGVGQSGNQAATNMNSDLGAGDHSTGNGAGFSDKDNASSFISSFRKTNTSDARD